METTVHPYPVIWVDFGIFTSVMNSEILGCYHFAPALFSVLWCLVSDSCQIDFWRDGREDYSWKACVFFEN